MSETTNYLALLREFGFKTWQELGRHLFRDIPGDENGALTGRQMRSYMQYSFGLAEKRSGEILKALSEIGIIQSVDTPGTPDSVYGLHPKLREP